MDPRNFCCEIEIEFQDRRHHNYLIPASSRRSTMPCENCGNRERGPRYKWQMDIPQLPRSNRLYLCESCAVEISPKVQQQCEMLAEIDRRNSNNNNVNNG
jgi:phage terminase large subunit GpA-like protein